eukprot:PLAT3915.1.p2 GENE.PLAT3915.1~~PLAT3915.1.p2  ORF type:complete len:420 (+),score=106.34 PLAT3915.1:1074-2333(+)
MMGRRPADARTAAAQDGHTAAAADGCSSTANRAAKRHSAAIRGQKKESVFCGEMLRTVSSGGRRRCACAVAVAALLCVLLPVAAEQPSFSTHALVIAVSKDEERLPATLSQQLHKLSVQSGKHVTALHLQTLADGSGWLSVISNSTASGMVDDFAQIPAYVQAPAQHLTAHLLEHVRFRWMVLMPSSAVVFPDRMRAMFHALPAERLLWADDSSRGVIEERSALLAEAKDAEDEGAGGAGGSVADLAAMGSNLRGMPAVAVLSRDVARAIADADEKLLAALLAVLLAQTGARSGGSWLGHCSSAGNNTAVLLPSSKPWAGLLDEPGMLAPRLCDQLAANELRSGMPAAVGAEVSARAGDDGGMSNSTMAMAVLVVCAVVLTAQHYIGKLRERHGSACLPLLSHRRDPLGPILRPVSHED